MRDLGRAGLLHDIAEKMAHQEMALLNPGRDLRWRVKGVLREFGARRRGFASEGDGDATAVVCGLKSREDVLARAAGRDAESDITGLREGFDLAREDGFESEVVAVRGENGGVGRERESGQGRTIHTVAHDEFGGEMLRICSAASIAEKDDLLAVFQRGEPYFGQRGDLILHPAELGDGVLMLREVRLEEG